MTDFSKYTAAMLSALTKTFKSADLIARKQDILEEVYKFHDISSGSTLFVGFNPAMLSGRNGSIFACELSLEVQTYLTNQGIEYTLVHLDQLIDQKFDVVIAMDEYFTFAADNQAQQRLVGTLCALANKFVITTLRDYKNQDFKDREFSSPAVIRSERAVTVYTEFHDWNYTDRNRWNSTLHEICDTGLATFGPFNRQAMFFKQLANFSAAVGVGDFTVHKNLMYKSAVRKNYEHVISMKLCN
jgi:hypothetical protein